MEQGTWAKRRNVSKVDMNCWASRVDRKGNCATEGLENMSLGIVKWPWKWTKLFAALATSFWNHRQDKGPFCETYYPIIYLPHLGKKDCLTPASAGSFKNTELKSRTTLLINRLNILYSSWQVSGFENGYRQIKLNIPLYYSEYCVQF